jgi:hypothetical protein
MIMILTSSFYVELVGASISQKSIAVSSSGAISYSPLDPDVTIISPQPRYYTASVVPIQLTSAAEPIAWNLYNGTHWLYSSQQTYTSPTQVVLDNGEYELQVWVANQLVNKVVFGVNLRNIGAVYATGGSSAEIQAAVNGASDGYAVYLPAGSYVFDSATPLNTVDVPVGISIYGAPTLRDETGHVPHYGTVLNLDYAASEGAFLFDYTGSSSYVTRFTGFKMVGYREVNSSSPSMTSGIFIHDGGASEFRFDHIAMRNLAGYCLQTYNGYGVVDHCEFTNYPAQLSNSAGWDALTAWYAINFGSNPGRTWSDIPTLAGQYTTKTLFVEDNYFLNWFSPVTITNGAHAVLRHNIIINGMVHNHHGASETNPRGGQLMEVYDNTFTLDLTQNTGVANIGIQDSSGGMIIFNNIDNGYGVQNNDPSLDYIGFIQLRQYNPDEWGSQYQVHNVWMYDNTLNPATSDLLDVHAPEIGSNPITLNVDYFLRAPTLAQDGFAYTPYTYPHPLVD